VQLPGK